MLRLLNRSLASGVVTLLCGLAAAGSLSAQTAEKTEPWLTVRPLFYFSNTDGETYIGQTGARIEMEDSVLVTNWAVQAELRYRRWAMWLEGAYSSTANVAEIRPGSVPLRYSFRLLTLEALAGYRLGDVGGITEFLVLAGARYYDAEQGLEDTYLEDSWVSPVVGAQAKAHAARRLSFWVRSDIGARIDRKSVAWELRVGLDWQLLEPIGIAAQYRFLTLNQPFKFGEDFAFEGTSQGWMLGLVVTP